MNAKKQQALANYKLVRDAHDRYIDTPNVRSSQRNSRETGDPTAGGPRGMVQLQTLVLKTVKLPRSCRFSARRQFPSEARVNWIGSALYLATLRLLYKENNLTPPVLLFLLILTITSNLPVIVGWFCYNTKFLARIRDIVLSFHFLVHHVISPIVLVNLGVSYRHQLRDIQHAPTLFLFSLTFCQSIPWHIVDVLIYRIRFKAFLLAQPLLVASALPFELDSCAWAQRDAGGAEAVNKSFVPFSLWLQRVFNFVLPISFPSPPLRDHNPPFLKAAPTASPEGACYRVVSFLFIFLALNVTGFVVFWQERQSWRRFLNSQECEHAMRAADDRQKFETALRQVCSKEAMRLTPIDMWEQVSSLLWLVMSAAVVWKAVDVGVDAYSYFYLNSANA